MKVKKPVLIVLGDTILELDYKRFISFNSSAVGLDYVIHPNFSVRMGYNSMSDLGKLSLGAGLILGDVDLDVSYKPMLYFGETYRLGLSFGFK